MSEIKAVLLVPAEDDPHGLLREGPCGARPPMAYLYKRAWAPCTARGAHSFDKRRALVLAWGGEPVEVGCFYAAQGSRFLSPTSVRNIVQFALRGAYHGDRPILEERGTFVLLDAALREVSDE